MDHPFAVVLCAADPGEIPSWAREASERNWSLVVLCHGPEPRRFAGFADSVVCVARGAGRWPTLCAFLQQHLSAWEHVTHVWCPDADIGIERERVGQFFELVAGLQLSVAQPALDWESRVPSIWTYRNPAFAVRYCDGIDLDLACFSRPFLLQALPRLAQVPAAPGLNFSLAAYLANRPGACAIIDAITAQRAPVPVVAAQASAGPASIEDQSLFPPGIVPGAREPVCFGAMDRAGKVLCLFDAGGDALIERIASGLPPALKTFPQLVHSLLGAQDLARRQRAAALAPAPVPVLSLATEPSAPAKLTGQPELVVVLGMHRSGTSAITRGLQVLGVQLGDRLLPAHADANAKGFWEDVDVLALNMELLRAIGSDWDHVRPVGAAEVRLLRESGFAARAAQLLRSKMGSAARYGFKDPRVARLLGFWREVFREYGFDARYLLTSRHPLSVAMSLAKRDGIDREHSYLMWLEHVINSLARTSGARRVVVDYDRLMSDPARELGRVARQLGLPLDTTLLREFQAQFLDERLRNTQFGPQELERDEACPALVREVYATLLDLAADRMGTDDPRLGALLARWSAELDRLQTALVLVDKCLLRLAAARALVGEREGKLAALAKLIQEQTALFQRSLAGRDEQIAAAQGQVAERDEHIRALQQTVCDLQLQLTDMRRDAAALDGVAKCAALLAPGTREPLSTAST